MMFGFPSLGDKKAVNLVWFIVIFCALQASLRLDSDRTNRTLAAIPQP